MVRSNYASFWQSRIKLAASSAVLTVLVVLIDYRKVSVELTMKEQATVDDVLEDLDYAIETMKYLQDIQQGKIGVRAVVEEKKPVIEFYWWCSLVPPFLVKNEPWVENNGIIMYSAHYDDRKNSLFPENHVIQVLSMSFRSIDNHTKVYCNIYHDRRYTVVEGYIREIWQRGWDPRDHFYIPNLITCPLPHRFKDVKELIISVSRKPCQSQQTAIKVKLGMRETKKKSVAVCVKGMDFQEEISNRLIEWLEAQYLLGADTISIYTYTVSKKTEDVLKYYESLGKLEQIRLSLPGDSPNIPIVRSQYILRNRQQKRRHELIPYNNCLYRHIRSHRYILIIDIDEVIVPLKHNTYEELLDEIEEKNPRRIISSISLRNVFKFPAENIDKRYPGYLYMLRHNQRSRKTSAKGEYGKSFTSTATVATVFNHFALHRLTPKVSATVYVPEEIGIKLHYKSKCPIESKKECPELEGDMILDTSFDKFANELLRRVNNTIEILGI